MILDQEARSRAIQETGKSFAVEASAGTGKTRTLVDRIGHLVLTQGPDGEPLPLRRICAITFTEKAAGEMKLRLREKFEQKAAAGSEEGERAREALRDLEFASISTIHALAVSLLKERPVEAGLDPRFAALDDATRSLLFEGVWGAWVREALEARVPHLERALREGLALTQLRELAWELTLHAYVVRTLTLEPPMTEEQLRAALTDCTEELLQYRKKSAKSSDKLLDALDRTVAWLRCPDWGRLPSKASNSGAAANWDGGKETVADVRRCISGIVDSARTWRFLPRQRVLDGVIRWVVAEFLTLWERRKLESGVLDFDDQLQVARDLLRNRSVRRAFLQRFRTVLVDEFQDTDAVQLELALLLSSEDVEETDPAKLRPAPGRLFIVGDPKQSIYRFRGADIESYLRIVDRSRAAALGLERLDLTTNFRSLQPILSFVDGAFQGVMSRSGLHQPDYLPFGAGNVRSLPSASMRVRVLCQRDTEGGLSGSGKGYAAAEARDIACLVRRIVGNPDWLVEDPPGRVRAPEYGDIAVLMPVLTQADLLEREFHAREVPYVLEGGRFYFSRAEVSSAVTALAAIDNPNDRVSLYGTLHSVFFGLSDEELLRAHYEGVSLDYRGNLPSGSPLARPFEVLRELHSSRNLRTPAETMERLLRQTGAREALATLGLQPLANLAKLVRRLRAVQNGLTFSETLRIIRSMEEEEAAEGESRLMEERGNAVRIMSVHRSKGLDFRIVIVAGLGSLRQNREGRFLSDPHQTRSYAVSIRKTDGFMTPGWESLKERETEHASAELVRLLYVALTRARDHLVVSLRAKGKQTSDGWSFSNTRLEPLVPFFSGQVQSPGQLFEWIPAGLDDFPAEPAKAAERPASFWADRFAAEQAQLRSLLSSTPITRPWNAPAGVTTTEDQDRTDWDSPAPRARAVRLGSAFHDLMETVDFDNPDDAGRLAREVGVRFELDTQSAEILLEMARTTLTCGLVTRARDALANGRRVYREVPYSRSLRDVRGGIEEGRIDLLFDDGGKWVVVDYKTDLPTGTPGEFRALLEGRYGPQLTAYAAALGSAGVEVAEAYLLVARTGEAVRVALP